MVDNKVYPVSPDGKPENHGPGFEVVPPDSRLENGPLGERSCTDCICFLIFVLFTIAMFYISIYAFTMGNPSQLAKIYDWQGNNCGKGDASDYPYLYFPNPLTTQYNLTVCVSTCPVNGQIDCYTKTVWNGESCSDYWDPHNVSNSFFVYDTYESLKIVCMPAALSTNFTALNSTLQNLDIDKVEDWISDFRIAWPMIIVTGGIAVIVGFLYMVFMRWCSGVLVWLSVFTIVLSLGGLGYLCYKKAKDIETNNDAIATAETGVKVGTADESNDEDTRKIFLALAYFFWVLCAAAAIGSLCFYHRIQLAIAVMKSAAMYVIDVPTCLSVPPVLTTAFFAYVAYYIASAVYLFSVGSMEQRDNLPIGRVVWTSQTRYFNYFYWFGILWINAFVMALSQFVLASSACIWYFSDKGQSIHRPIMRSYWRGFRYHLGSLAFGSLILAIVQAIRFILAYIHAKAKQSGAAKSNKFIEYAFRCLECCMMCFERFIRFLNKVAYIQIALTGKNFISAAKDGFMLAWHNPLRFAVVQGLGGIFDVLGKIFICFLGTLIGYGIITNVNYYNDRLSSPVCPTMAFMLLGYAVGSMFMSVYTMAIDTVLQCFCLDETLQKMKGAQTPLWAPEPLKDFFDKHDKN